MNWFRWLLVIGFALEIISSAFTVGTDRGIRTGGEAAIVAAINLLFIIGVLLCWGGK